MSIAPFGVAVLSHEEVALAGMRIATTMKNASADCPALWQHFMARAPEICDAPEAGPMGASYGLSYMTHPATGDFDYVAAMPLPPEKSLPAGMERFTLPAGLYARTIVPKLDQIGDAYTYLYTAWIAGQSDYALNMTAPCFERYDERFLQSGEFEIYVPVVKK